MKTKLALILAILMLLAAFAGCRQKTEPAAETTPAPTEAPAAEAPATEVPATEAPTEEHPNTELPEISADEPAPDEIEVRFSRRGTTSRPRWTR